MPDRPREIRRLLLSGDNILKNRGGRTAVERARERYERAGELARELGDPALTTIIRARLDALPTEDG